MHGSIIEFRAEVKKEIKSLREDLIALNDSVSNLSVCLQEHKKCLQEHKEQTAAELAHLQTTLNSTQSSLETKLDSLTATTAQLSSDHEQIQANISDVDCLDTEQSLELHQNMQDNLTHQLEKIQDDVTYIHSELNYTCGGTVGWRRVVYLNMTDPSTTCPSGWQLTGYSKRTCGRPGTRYCDPAIFPVTGRAYNRICGRIRAYQWGGTDAFWGYHHGRATTIDSYYVEGVSVTHGTPRNHIWTFAAGAAEGSPTDTYVCPCDASIDIRIPPFVGEDYFCESGINGPWPEKYVFHPNDTLWDGEDCLPSSTCCSQHNPPYFVKQLPTSTTEDIEARICSLQHLLDPDNIAIGLIELYVQ